MTYENARRAGKTNPDLREMIDRLDPRHFSNRGRFLNGKLIVPNRADRRANGERSSYGRSPFRKAAKRTS